MTPVRAVFFDLDNTLLDYDETAYAETVRRVCSALAREWPGLDPRHLNDVFLATSLAFWRTSNAALGRAPSGAPSGLSLWAELWHEAAARAGCPTDAGDRAFDLYVADRRATYRLFDDAVGVLAAVRERCDAIVLVTNGFGDTQRDKVAVTGLARYVDGVVASGEIGAAKPDGVIFAAASRLAGVAPESVWHVGDNLLTDVGGARDAGLGGAVWVNRTGAARGPDTPEPDHEIAALSELLPLLEVSARAGTGPVGGPARPRGG